MKLICVEEHIQSRELAGLAMPQMLAQAPYLPNWGKTVTDTGGQTDTSRPRVIATQDSLAKLLEFDAGRIAEMDAHGLDMQILSYAGLPHFEFNRATLGIGHLLFSVDYPHLSPNGARKWLENLPISDEDKAKIAHKNAERLFKLA